MSKPATLVPRLSLHQRLGELLNKAHLISPAQIEVALLDQQQNVELRFGEILALRGWLRQETADFFAEQWQMLMREPQKDALGIYLQRAWLLDEAQVTALLEEQQQTGYRLGALAVLHGWLKQQTLDFFLESLYPDKLSERPFIQRQRNHHPNRRTQGKQQSSAQNQQPAPLFIHLDDQASNDSMSNSPQRKPEEKDGTIPWID